MPNKKTNPAAGDRGARQEFSDQNKPADNSQNLPAAQVKLEGRGAIVAVARVTACHLIVDYAVTWGEWPRGETWQWEFAGISSAGEVHWRRFRIGTGDPVVIRAEPRETVPIGEPVRVARPGPKKRPGVGGGA
jgi:hypothetical protein